MTTRDQTVHRIAASIKVEARMIALRRLAAETSQLYAELIRCKVPPETARGFFTSNICSSATTRSGAASGSGEPRPIY